MGAPSGPRLQIGAADVDAYMRGLMESGRPLPGVVFMAVPRVPSPTVCGRRGE
jgi:hypothetical protein